MTANNENQAEVISAKTTLDEAVIVRKVSFVGIAGNIVLSAFKLFAGIVGNSGAMVSDAVHSLSDVFATFIAFLGVKMSGKVADKAHPYGHERMECVASQILGVILLITGLEIGKSGVTKIISGNYAELAVPGTIALIAAVVSIVTKEAMYWYTRHYAKILNSSAFMADAWHHRSDAFSSIGSLIGIAGARLGYPIMDSVASVIICLFILKVAFDILKDAVDKMVDKSCDAKTVEEMRQVISNQSGVKRIDTVQTRLFGTKIYVDIEVAADGKLTLEEGHKIAETVHDEIEEHFPLVKHCMVHINPI